MTVSAKKISTQTLALLCFLAISLLSFNCSGPTPASKNKDATRLEFSEIMYQGAGNDSLEFIELHNKSTVKVALAGLRITGAVSFIFSSSAVLLPADSFAVLTNDSALFKTRFPNVAVAGTYSGKLSNAGESISLLGTDSTEWLQCNYDSSIPWPTMAAGGGYALVFTGSDCRTASSWQAGNVLGGNPGKSDTPAQDMKITINEVLPGTSTQKGWLELANSSDSAVDISGWYLSTVFPYTLPMTLPAGTQVPAKGYLVISDSSYLGSFFPAITGGSIYLIQMKNGVITGYASSFKYPALADSQSAGITTLSDGSTSMEALSQLTPGAANAHPKVGPLVISELMYHPQDSGYEYLEITNTSSNTVVLTDASDANNTWTVGGVNVAFPKGDSIVAGAKILLINGSDASAKVFRQAYSVSASVAIYEYSGKLSNSTETVALKMPERAIAGSSSFAKGISDVVTYVDTLPWPSADGNGKSLVRKDFATAGSEPTNWVAETPSPGK